MHVLNVPVKFYAYRSTTVKVENGNTENIVLHYAFFFSLGKSQVISGMNRCHGYGLDTVRLGTQSSVSRTFCTAEYVYAFT